MTPSHERFVSYAQNGEDVVLARSLQPDDNLGFWIDVGAADPIVDSVTAAFSERGWTGINIDPWPPYAAALEAARPGEVNLCCAVGSAPGIAKLHPGPEESPGLATLLPEFAHTEEAPPIEVEVRTLADIVARVDAPRVVDFLKIDVEGWEREVLAGNDWSSLRPRIVVVEATAPGTSQPTFASWEPILLDEGYRFVLFDGLNRFYVAPGEDELAASLSAPANVLDDYVPFHWRAEFARLEEYTHALEAGLIDERSERDRERLRLTREVRLAQAGLAQVLATVEDLREDLAASQERAARALADLRRLEGTRTFRYSASARKWYSTVRRASGR